MRSVYIIRQRVTGIMYYIGRRLLRIMYIDEEKLVKVTFADISFDPEEKSTSLCVRRPGVTKYTYIKVYGEIKNIRVAKINLMTLTPAFS